MMANEGAVVTEPFVTTPPHCQAQGNEVKEEQG